MKSDRPRILLVEHEPAVATPIRDRFETEGYRVTVAPDGTTAVELARERGFDAIVVDETTPGADLHGLRRDARGPGDDTPILVLTARDQYRDTADEPEYDVDDRLARPFEMAELLARIEALLRRAGESAGSAPSLYAFGDFRLDLRRRCLARGTTVIPLSTQEFKLLRYLYEHRGEVVDRDELLRAVWGYDESTYTRTVDVHVAWLRRKLDDRENPSIIVTVRGRGYKFARE